jgi:hypothetical protein
MIIVVVALAWIAVSVPLGLVLGFALREGDERARATDHLIGLPADLTVADILGARAPEPSH